MRNNSWGASHAMRMGIVVIALIAGMTGCPAGSPEPPEGDGPLTESAKLVPGDALDNDYFGSSVSISGGYAIVGAPEHGSNGAAYIFARGLTGWSQQKKLTAGDGASGDWFGCSVSISGDYAVVGARNDDDAGSSSGSAYVFVRSGTDWGQQEKLTAGDAAADDSFGASVSIDGDSVVVGAYGDDDKGSSAGAAYVFVRSGTDWSQQDKLTASDGAASDGFGTSVSIDGDSVVVGAYGDDDKGSSAGAAYIFVRSGSDWNQQAKLVATESDAGDWVGYSVSISGDSALVGNFEKGAAYLSVRAGSSWSLPVKLPASTTGDYLGRSVSISGTRAIVGATGDDDTADDAGAAYLFVLSGGAWSEQSKLLASDGDTWELFGDSVCVSGDEAIVGQYGLAGTGAAYIFD